MVIIILWLSGIASAFVDNIPFAATMVPVITSLSATMGVDLNALAWTLSMAPTSRQRHPHRGLRQRGGHGHCRQGGLRHRLGAVL